MRECRACRVEKPLEDYYLNNGRPMGKCKDCVKADVHRYRAENIEKVREYDRMRGDLPHRVTARKNRAPKYYKNGSYAKNWRAKNKEKRYGQVKLGNALRDGKIVRPNKCEACHIECRPHGHHEDYSKPLEVMWLCERCHGARHRVLNAMRRQAA